MRCCTYSSAGRSALHRMRKDALNENLRPARRRKHREDARTALCPVYLALVQYIYCTRVRTVLRTTACNVHSIVSMHFLGHCPSYHTRLCAGLTNVRISHGSTPEALQCHLLSTGSPASDAQTITCNTYSRQEWDKQKFHEDVAARTHVSIEYLSVDHVAAIQQVGTAGCWRMNSPMARAPATCTLRERMMPA